MPPTPEDRYEHLRREYVVRFEHICRDMKPEDFAQLVDEMARFRQKHEDLDASHRADEGQHR